MTFSVGQDPISPAASHASSEGRAEVPEDGRAGDLPLRIEDQAASSLEISREAGSEGQPAQEGALAPGRRRRWPRVLLASTLLFLLGLAGHQLLTWPRPSELTSHEPQSTAFIDHWRKQQQRAGMDGKLRWQPVPYGQISEHLKLAVLVSEDMEFFEHRGFSTHEIRAALRATLKEGKPLRGASTLSQQLVKNLWLSPSRNPWRKVKEAMLTWQLERSLDKRRILGLYLNVAELGPGIYGAQAAAQRYFAVDASRLSSNQAAALAAALPAPTQWFPGSGSQRARRRAATIHQRMQQAGWLRQHL